MEFVTNENKSKERSDEDNSSQSPINYPVGKPLEVSAISADLFSFSPVPCALNRVRFLLSDLFGRTVRRAVQSYIPSATRSDDSYGHRCYAVRFYTSIDHAPILESPTHVSEMQIHLGQ